MLKLKNFDHLVLNTANLAACLHFYVDILGMRHKKLNGRHALYFGGQKINIHTRPGEFLPCAQNPVGGSLDFCLIAEGNINEIKKYLITRGIKIAEGAVPRRGALGQMESVYIYDPDGNLVEIAVYRR